MPVRKFSRSGQMIDCLRRELLYSEKRARDLLFASIAAIVREARDQPLMVSRLTREAILRARTEAERVGFAFENWDHAGRAVVKAMLHVGVLLKPDGRPVDPGIAAPAAVVSGLHRDYVDRTEAGLLEFLLRRLGDVTTRDHRALAHALFRQFDPTVPLGDLEDRVAILLASLEGRVELDGEGYVVREPRLA